MKPSFVAIAIYCLLSSIPSKAQEVNCTSFCVTNIRMDSVTPNLMNVTIFFSSDSFAFINYPHVSSVIDDNGDTIGTGTINFFGQIGNSSVDFPVDTHLDSLPADFMATVVFNYDTTFCILPYPCSTTSVIHRDEIEPIRIYPNPFSDETTVHLNALDNMTLRVYNSGGQRVDELNIGRATSINYKRNRLSAGLYIFSFEKNEKIFATEKVIIVD